MISKEENGLGISHPTPSRNASTKREGTLSEKQGRNAKERTNQNGKAKEQRHWYVAQDLCDIGRKTNERRSWLLEILYSKIIHDKEKGRGMIC